MAREHRGLSQKAFKSYLDNGYCIVENFWTNEECFSFIDAIKSLTPNEKFRVLTHPHRVSDVLMRAFRDPRLVAIAEQLCGGEVSGLQSVWDYGEPGRPAFPIHQDNFNVEANPSTFVTAWCPMQDTDASMGGLIGWPKTHNLPTVPEDQVQFLADGYPKVDLFIPKGAALFLHQNFIHASHVNTSNKYRRTAIFTFLKKGSPFRPGNTAKREEIDVYN